MTAPKQTPETIVGALTEPYVPTNPHDAILVAVERIRTRLGATLDADRYHDDLTDILAAAEEQEMDLQRITDELMDVRAWDEETGGPH